MADLPCDHFLRLNQPPDLEPLFLDDLSFRFLLLHGEHAQQQHATIHRAMIRMTPATTAPAMAPALKEQGKNINDSLTGKSLSVGLLNHCSMCPSPYEHSRNLT